MKIILLSIIGLSLLFSIESTATYRVNGMMCAFNCPKKVNESLKGVEGIKSCKVDFESKTAMVLYDDDLIDSDKIAKTISKRTFYKIHDMNNKKNSDSFWDWLFIKN